MSGGSGSEGGPQVSQPPGASSGCSSTSSASCTGRRLAPVTLDRAAAFPAPALAAGAVSLFPACLRRLHLRLRRPPLGGHRPLQSPDLPRRHRQPPPAPAADPAHLIAPGVTAGQLQVGGRGSPLMLIHRTLLSL